MKPTPTIHCGDMCKLYGPSPFFKEGKVSNRGKRKIHFPRYEDELVPRGGAAIWIIREKGEQLKHVGK